MRTSERATPASRSTTSGRPFINAETAFVSRI
jgi:hypothetical protein